MPDGDIIRGLERLYHNPYKALSEGKATSVGCCKTSHFGRSLESNKQSANIK